MWRYANPHNFLKLCRALIFPLFLLAAITGIVGLVWGLVYAPADYQQGDSSRIMYVHVPAAWLSMLCYSMMALCSLSAIIWRHSLANLAAKAAAPVGLSFTAITLATGSLWGAPMWGTWWQWDARMTSVLVLLFIYLGYMSLWRAISDQAVAARSAAILCLVGALNLPIIKFSVEYFNTLHQPASILRLDGPSIDTSMLWPLFIMAASFTLLFFALWLTRTRTEIYMVKARSIEFALMNEEQ